MIEVSHIQVSGFEAAVRGMRNPMNSWGKSDSKTIDGIFYAGPNDLKLMLSLAKAGPDHRKYTRMIHVQMDILAPLYWWKDYDTYKVGTVANSCSTMHKIHAKEFTREDFAHDQMEDLALQTLDFTIDALNIYREIFVRSGLKDKSAWYSMIQLLPTSYLQRRTVDVSYEVLVNMVSARQKHKLEEFRELCSLLKESLPYFKDILDSVNSRYKGE